MTGLYVLSSSHAFFCTLKHEHPVQCCDLNAWFKCRVRARDALISHTAREQIKANHPNTHQKAIIQVGLEFCAAH